MQASGRSRSGALFFAQGDERIEAGGAVGGEGWTACGACYLLISGRMDTGAFADVAAAKERR